MSHIFVPYVHLFRPTLLEMGRESGFMGLQSFQMGRESTQMGRKIALWDVTFWIGSGLLGRKIGFMGRKSHHYGTLSFPYGTYKGTKKVDTIC